MDTDMPQQQVLVDEETLGVFIVPPTSNQYEANSDTEQDSDGRRYEEEVFHPLDKDRPLIQSVEGAREWDEQHNTRPNGPTHRLDQSQ